MMRNTSLAVERGKYTSAMEGCRIDPSPNY